MNTEFLKTRQTKYTAYITVYILIVIGVLGLANWLAQRHNKSFDATANKRYSLSDQTIKVVSGLKQDVKINYFDRTSEFTRAKDLLDRYDNLSSKLQVNYIDPDKKPQLAKVAGIRNYGTIQIDVGPKREEAKSLSEEEVTGALIRGLKGGDRTVCFVTGSGEHSLEDSGRSGYSNAKELIERNNYKTKSINLLEKAEIPKDCTIVAVAGPRFDYVAPVVAALKAYVVNGGHALFLLDPPLKLGKEETAENAELQKVLYEWNVVMNKDLVVDTSGLGQIFGLNEVVPLVTKYESHPITREMKETASAVILARTVDSRSGGPATVEKLFSTSENSYATTNLSAAEMKIDPNKDKKGPLNLAIAGTIPREGGAGRFVVVGSSGWIANNLLRFNGNRDLFMNMLNWLSSDEDLISIRPKEPEDRRLSLTRSQMSMIFYMSVLFLPLIVVAAGVSVWWRRR